MSSRDHAPRAASHTCLVCREEYWLSEANHDGWGTVCPNCGAL